MPRLSLDQVETMGDMIQFREELQQLIYTEIEQVKVYREHDLKLKKSE